jgi:hypothetical protein
MPTDLSRIACERPTYLWHRRGQHARRVAGALNLDELRDDRECLVPEGLEHQPDRFRLLMDVTLRGPSRPCLGSDDGSS